ncbi:MAG: ABC transporter substrate-binding protein [Burkholderiales bacterium]
MKRRVLLLGTVAGATGARSLVAQTAMRRVGVLEAAAGAANMPRRAAFLRGLRGLGWEEGRNLEMRFVSADGNEDRLDTLARELVTARMEVIATSAAISTRSLLRATRSVPVVMVTVADPVGNGFVQSLARPGGNVTGLSNQQEDVLGKVIEALVQLVPAARRVAVVINGNSPAQAAYRRATTAAAAVLGRHCPVLTVNSPAEIAALASQVREAAAQAVVVTADPLFTGHATALGAALTGTRLPVAYGLRLHLAHGGVLSFGVNFEANWEYAARFVDRILKGTRPADIPVELPMRFELVVSRGNTRAMGLRIPDTLLARADEIID